jgi:3-dehydroquinate synthase
MGEPTVITVTTGAPYDVVVGRDVVRGLAAMLPSGVTRAAVMHPAVLAPLAARVGADLEHAGLQAVAIEVPDGEAAKTAEVAASCWASLGRAGLTRSDAVIGLGGGSTTDLAGFVAATFLRGIAIVQVPTSLLGMVDAAVGGKTGINTAQGKNLVGAFHEPVGVLCDLAMLASLDPAELVSGLAEVVKCGFIADPAILDLVERAPAAVQDPEAPQLRELVERAIAVKAEVVGRDLHEATSVGGRVGREALNYGHTLGHAIERVEHYTIRHGEAIAIGMVFVAELARLAGRLDADTCARHRSVLSSLGLPTTYGGPWTDLLDGMRVDKKARGQLLRFVVLDAVGSPAILEGPEPSLLEAAYAEISG